MTEFIHSEFWRFKLAHVLTILTMLGAIIMFTMRFENRVSQIENMQRSMLETDARLIATVERMDQTGTYASQRGILKDSENSISNTRRIESLEGVAREIGPKVERLNTNMDWLIGTLKDTGALKRDTPRSQP